MTKKKEQAVEPKLIRIVAESEIYSVNEVVPESKCVQRLKSIRSNFVDYRQKY